jgi:3',5'-cyclic AMP phosphodiesterase CpdA
VPSDSYSFTTSRPAGVGYTFAVEADPHYDENFDAPTYAETLASILQAKPDFMIDLGDASMIEKLAPSTAGAAQRYQIVRSWWERIGGSVPIYMALGNHDGENGVSLQGSAGSFGPTAARLRQSLFPAPVPGAFYTGNQAGTYYSFEWGDALFVVLDPFSYTMRKPRELDFWSWTLGKAQYDWLQDTLQRSRAAYKFVFIHHLVGGVNKDTRGGVAIAPYREWGGLNSEGVNTFGTEQPGWLMPIKDLLEKYHVDVVFHGHDHFYAREQLGGVIYQLVPQPGQPKARMSSKQAAGWGYTTGTALPSPGFLSVEVTPQAATVSYVQSGTVVDSYVIKP